MRVLEITKEVTESLAENLHCIQKIKKADVFQVHD